MRTYLLDANVLIALVVDDHEHHARAVDFTKSVGRVALCPIVEGALARFLVGAGSSALTAGEVLGALYATGRCEFWPDSISYRDVDLEHVLGHRQVTDAYLASLAASRGGLLATFDKALAAALPDVVELLR